MRMGVVVFLEILGLVAGAGCRRDSARGAQVSPPETVGADGGAARAPAAQRRARMSFYAGIYCNSVAATPTRAMVEKLVAQKWPRFRVAEGQAPREQPTVALLGLTLADVPTPPLTAMRFASIDLTPSEQQRFAQSKGVLTLEISDAAADAPRTLADANALLLALTGSRDCFIWDSSARLGFSAKGWQARRIATFDAKAPDVKSQINIHHYKNGSLARMVTLGMEKLGLPDVAVDQFAAPPEDVQLMINWICQSLWRGPLRPDGRLTLGPPPKGAPPSEKPIEVQLQAATPQEGDAEPLVELVFPGPPTATLQTRQNALLRQLFGAANDPFRSSKADDEELLAASRRARARLPELATRFRKGLSRQRLHLKVPFYTPNHDGAEFMWIEVTSWKDSAIGGVLLNDSFDPDGPKIGAHVQAKEADVYDYLIRNAQGQDEGGETEKIFEARAKKSPTP